MTPALRSRDAARRVLVERFGHDEFQEGQWESIEALLAGRDALVVMPTGSGKSLVYQLPALITETTNAMTISREEVFGPVANVIRVRDYEEALAMANDTEFGLSAGLCTRSLKHAAHFKLNAQAGMVMINLPTAGVDYHVPFGGSKGSSYGSREQGTYAREFYTTVKTAYTFAG